MARQKLSGTIKRKKTGAKKSTHRRRRIGASGSIQTVAMNGVAVGAGVVAIREIAILAGSMVPSLMATPVMNGIVQIAIGGFAALKGKSGFLMYAGLGAMGNGVMTVLNGAGIIAGPPQQMSYNFANRRTMGDPRLQFVAGPGTRVGSYPNNFSSVAGIGAAGGRKRRFTS